MTRDQARLWRRKIEHAASTLPDIDAIESIKLFSVWKSGTNYAIHDRVRYKSKLYRCEQAHTSQEDWTPDSTPAIWSEIATPGEIPVWRQPTGAQDSYNTGDKVKYPDNDGSVYESILDANVFEPTVYGWEEVE